MQFKTVGARIQVIAYLGYDKVKKRAITKTLGSLSRYTFTPSDGLIEGLTVEQNKELQSYIDTARQSSKSMNRQSDVNLSDRLIDSLADSLADEETTVTEAQAIKIWVALGRVQQALKKRGHKRPAPDNRVDSVPDSRQAKLPV